MEPTDIKAIADMTHQILKSRLEEEVSAACAAKMEKEYVLIPKRTWLRFMAYIIMIPVLTAGFFIGVVKYFLNTEDALTAARQIQNYRDEAAAGSQTIQDLIKSLQGGDQTKGYFRLGDNVVCYGMEPASAPAEATHTRKVAFDFPKAVQYDTPPQVTLTVHSQGSGAMFAVFSSNAETGKFSASLNNTRQWSPKDGPADEGGVTTADVKVTYIAIGKGKISAATAPTP
jgi:hypothetical protein